MRGNLSGKGRGHIRSFRKKQSEGGIFAAFGLFLFFLEFAEGDMESKRSLCVLTNNPLAKACLPADYQVDFENISYREVLIKARDRIYAGHRLYTHPLAGSVKPNETPYRSVVISRTAKGMEPEEAALIASAVETFDKFTPRKRALTPEMLSDFQLIDYTLLCGALGLDAAAGLSKQAPREGTPSPGPVQREGPAEKSLPKI